MRKFGLFILAAALAAAMQAQEKKSLGSMMSKNNILNHLDVGVSVGTVGIGIDVAVPVTDYVRIRTGYHFMPRFNIHTNFPIETRNGSISKLISKVGKIDEKLEELGFDINSEGYEDYKEMLDKFRNVEQKDYVTVGMKPNLHQFKFLVDVMPFKRNRHWSLTAGFFIGSSTVGEACNLEKETLLLEGINAYNRVYAEYPEKGINGAKLHEPDHGKEDPFYRYGLAGFPLGYFSDGEKAMMVPGKDNSVHAEMEMGSFRPYLGLGYNTHLSRNKKWNLNVDAGVLFLTGKRKIYVDNVYKFNDSELRLTGEYDEIYLGGIGVDTYDKYYGEIMRYTYDPETDHEEYIYCGNIRQHVDLVNDLHDIPGKVGDLVDFVSKLKVYPNLTVTFSYRLY